VVDGRKGGGAALFLNARVWCCVGRWARGFGGREGGRAARWHLGLRRAGAVH
jgi:hypothetical protein